MFEFDGWMADGGNPKAQAGRRTRYPEAKNCQQPVFVCDRLRVIVRKVVL